MKVLAFCYIFEKLDMTRKWNIFGNFSLWTTCIIIRQALENILLSPEGLVLQA